MYINLNNKSINHLRGGLGQLAHPSGAPLIVYAFQKSIMAVKHGLRCILYTIFFSLRTKLAPAKIEVYFNELCS